LVQNAVRLAGLLSPSAVRLMVGSGSLQGMEIVASFSCLIAALLKVLEKALLKVSERSGAFSVSSHFP
jgi:hypothetical protein